MDERKQELSGRTLEISLMKKVHLEHVYRYLPHIAWILVIT